MDYTDQTIMLTGYIISNLVALLMLWFSRRKPVTARALFFLLFVWAGVTNATTSISTPGVYLEYADFTFLSFYKSIILGFFGRNITVIVMCIAICQLLIGVSMILKGVIFKLGCIGGILFLIGITPLGVGSGAPATLTWAVGLYLLYRRGAKNYWWSSFRKQQPSGII